MGTVTKLPSWKEKTKQWKDMDDMALLMEAVSIILQSQIPEGSTIKPDTEQQRKARLMQVELQTRLNKGKSNEERYREALKLIAHNAEKLMPEYQGDEERLVEYMNNTKNPVLRKMYAIRQYANATLKGEEVPPTSTPTPPKATA